MVDIISPQNPEPTPNPSPTPTPQPAPAKSQPPEEKTHFSLEYVQELRAENAKYRHSAKEAREHADQAEQSAQKAKQDAQDSITQAQKTANDRIIRAELKAVAIKAGMVDLDGLKLADLSTVVLDENGDVKGAEELMNKLKESKPYLFAEPKKTTTVTDPVPPKGEPKKFNAKTATDEERAAEAKRLGIKIKL
ncbi:phage scaffolding protein [Martelella alba]|nr:phage scaffolding protein [Martelella alba]